VSLSKKSSDDPYRLTAWRRYIHDYELQYVGLRNEVTADEFK